MLNILEIKLFFKKKDRCFGHCEYVEHVKLYYISLFQVVKMTNTSNTQKKTFGNTFPVQQSDRWNSKLDM